MIPSMAKGNGQVNAWMQEDTIKFSRDSLLRIIQMKDSLLLQASLDSMATNDMLEMIWWEKDSIQEELQSLHYVLHLDSLYENRRDSLWAEFNRSSRWALRDSLFDIEEDSVRSNLGQLLELVYDNSTRHQNPQRLRELWDQLIYNLGNDSTFFWIHYADGDSISVILKDKLEVKKAIFLTNQQADSAKVYLRGSGKHDLHMWVDENIFLTHLLKRTSGNKQVYLEYKDVSLLKIPKKKLPTPPTEYWTSSATMVFALNQWAFSNWAKGGDNRLTFLLDTKGNAKYQKGKFSWDNKYWYRFGLIKSEGQRLHKNVDLMRINSDLQHKAFKKMSYSVLGQFDSQLFRGYRTSADLIPNSKFMAPATFNLGGGMVYIASKNFSVNLQPISGKFTFVLDTIAVDQKKYGLKEGQRVKGEPGATLNINYIRLLWKNINMKTELKLFSNYLNNPQNIDVDLTTQFTLKVNKYVSTTLFLYAKYDDDIIIPFYEWKDGEKEQVGEGKRLQIQQTFGITFTYYIL